MRSSLTLLALAGAMLLPPAADGARAQSGDDSDEVPMRFGIPDVDRGARNRVAFRLQLYYYFMQRLGGVPFDEILGCSADRGERCFDGGDWETTCRLSRCRTPSETGRFIDELVELAEQYPHSPEAMGQAVYAAVRVRRTAKVEGLLDGCEPADAWWCDLLRGYLLHATRRSAEAQEPVALGLAAAPAEMRCRLEDMAQLLEGDVREAYEALHCEARLGVHEHLWWLADPFWIQPGNDRRVEHVMRGFSVPFHESILRASDSAFAVHSAAHDRARIRRGYRDSWAPPPGARDLDAESAGYTSRRSAFNHFVPDSIDLFAITPQLTWRVEAGRGDEGWTRPDGPVLAAPAQTVRFMDDDQLSIALASDLGRLTFEPPWVGAESRDRPDPTGASRLPPRPPGGFIFGDEAAVVAPGQAYFVTSEGPGHLAQLDPVPIRERVTFAVAVPNRAQVAGLEVFSPGASARHRVPVMPLSAGRPEVSDLLLFRPYGPDLPQTRLGAVALMWGTREIADDQRLGIYWEAYRLPRDEPIQVAISIAGTEIGLLDRVGGLLGLGRGDTPTTVRWMEPPLDDEEPLLRRSVTIDLEGLELGSQEVLLELTLPDGTTLARRVGFTVVDAGEGAGG
jgi:hypothetical protein